MFHHYGTENKFVWTNYVLCFVVNKKAFIRNYKGFSLYLQKIIIMCKAIAIDVANKPKNIPYSKWLIKDREYTIIYTVLCLPQKEIGVILAELELDESCAPHEYFKLNRFAFTAEDLKLLQELIKNCNETDFSIEELLEQTTLEEV